MTGGQTFFLWMMAIFMIGGALSAWGRGRQCEADGERLSGRSARRAARRAARRGTLMPSDEIEAERKIQLLSSENDRLTGQVSRLEERIAVLERIATDPAERVAREIDGLR